MGVRSNFFSHFSMKLLLANSIVPDGTPRSAASHLGLHCLPMSHKKNARLISVNVSFRALKAPSHFKRKSLDKDLRRLLFILR